MKRALLIGTGSVVFFLSLACGGGGNAGNAKACKEYVKAFNDLSCMPDSAKLDAATTCPDNLDMSPVDMTEYYNCLAKASKCNGDIPDMSGASECKAPGM